MAPRLLFGRGAHGDLIRSIQRALTRSGFDTKGTDGVFGDDTARAVHAFQTAHGIPPTGAVDVDTWSVLMHGPAPSVRRRALGVTAAIEGHGFTLALGNFDGAGITWGIIGFTLRHGELPKIVLTTNERNPALLSSIFAERTDELIRIMRAPWSEQRLWADAVSLGKKKVRLAEPWHSCFAVLGEDPGVQQLQLDLVDEDYFQPARKTAAAQGLTTELGIALAFDIHVQNGGIKAAARSEIAEALAKRPPQHERDTRLVIADAVANQSSAKWREDVRTRKRAIATGKGTVHGMNLELRNWGPDELPFQE